MTSFKTLAVFAALLPALVASSPLPQPEAALSTAGDTRSPGSGIIGTGFDGNYRKRGLSSSHPGTTSTKSNSAISVSADVSVKLKGLVSQLLSLLSGNNRLPSSYQGLCNAANQLVGATDGTDISNSIDALKKQVETLLKTASGDLKTKLQAIASQLEAIHGVLPAQTASLGQVLDNAIGGTVRGLLQGLGLNVGTITLPSVPSISASVALPSVALPSVALPSVALPSVALPSVALPSVALPSISVPSVAVPSIALPSASGSATVDINADIRSLVSRLLSLLNGGINIPSGVSLQNLLSAANQLATCKSANAVADSLGSLSTAINNLISSSTAVTGDLRNQLQALSKAVDEVKKNLVGQAVTDLNSNLAASGGTLTGLLSGLGLNVDLSLFTKGTAAVGTPVTGDNTVDLTADLQSAVNTLNSLVNWRAVPAGVSLQNLINAARNLVNANSASAVSDAASAVAAETSKLLSSGAITGDLLKQLQSLSKVIDNIKKNLVGQAITDLNSKLASSGGTVCALLSKKGTNVNSSLLNAIGNVVNGSQGKGLILGLKANVGIGR